MKKILTALLALGIIFSFAACGSEGATEDAASTEPTVTYESIYDEYAQKIKDATPRLIEEYNNEAAEKAGDINALAEFSNAKIEKLAEISNEGIEKMAELMFKNGDSDETYTEWANKLTDVYMDEAQKITDEYMNSATGL